MAATSAAVRETMFPLPAIIEKFRGEINDLDTHDALPVTRWVDEFGSATLPLVKALTQGADGNRSVIRFADVRDDDAEINAHNVWNLKLEKAPGAFDLERRLEVMDFTGVNRQLMYPGSLGLFAGALYGNSDNPNVLASITGDRKGYAIKMIDLYNDWCARITNKHSRIRPSAIIVADTPDAFYDKLKYLIDRGVRLAQVVPDELPGGVSPASPELDRAWALAADANFPILAHISSNEAFLKSMEWREAPAFKGWKMGSEFSLDPWTLSNIHLAVQNYLTTMVLGGVFDRHPNLRFGVAEFTGHWVGPFAENMDRWYAYTPFNSSLGDRTLKMRPSDYIRRNVRVACFDFEPVGKYIRHFGFEEVLCYASDFPHYEGGTDPINNFVNSLAGQSEEVYRKFFVDNGKLLLPD